MAVNIATLVMYVEATFDAADIRVRDRSEAAVYMLVVLGPFWQLGPRQGSRGVSSKTTTVTMRLVATVF